MGLLYQPCPQWPMRTQLSPAGGQTYPLPIFTEEKGGFTCLDIMDRNLMGKLENRAAGMKRDWMLILSQGGHLSKEKSIRLWEGTSPFCFEWRCQCLLHKALRGVSAFFTRKLGTNGQNPWWFFYPFMLFQVLWLLCDWMPSPVIACFNFHAREVWSYRKCPGRCAFTQNLRPVKIWELLENNRKWIQ